MKGSDEPLGVDFAANIQLRHARQRRQDQTQRTTTQMGKNVIGIVLGFSCDALNERTLRKLGRIWHAGYQGPGILRKMTPPSYANMPHSKQRRIHKGFALTPARNLTEVNKARRSFVGTTPSPLKS